jgi:hypothetical protein
VLQKRHFKDRLRALANARRRDGEAHGHSARVADAARRAFFKTFRPTNLKIAKALGLVVRPMLLARADEYDRIAVYWTK